jgi:hypothetical protein
MSLSYKDAFTNMLIVFVNQRIKESKDMSAKVETLDEEKKKKFQKKVVDFITTKARALADLQGLNYVGVTDNVVIEWIDSFFDEFEANMKEPEPKPKAETRQKETGVATTITKAGAEKKITHGVEEGFFGLEVKIDKKTVLSKDDFISKIYSENEGKEITFTWEDDKVEVIVKDKTEKKKKEKKPEVTQQELDNEEIQNIDEENDDLELDGPITEKDITGGEVFEDEDDKDDEDETTEEETEEEEGFF